MAPCQGYISKEDYAKQVDDALDFLNGNYNKILKTLEAQMQEAAEKMEYEERMERERRQKIEEEGFFHFYGDAESLRRHFTK